MTGHFPRIHWILPACSLALGICGSASGVDQITWPGSPTPVTFQSFEVARTPCGMLISWKASGERRIRGYRVQSRARGESWRSVSPLIAAGHSGPHGSDYAWHHRGAEGMLEYRLVEVSRGGMVLPIDATEPAARKARMRRRKQRAESVRSGGIPADPKPYAETKDT